MAQIGASSLISSMDSSSNYRKRSAFLAQDDKEVGVVGKECARDAIQQMKGFLEVSHYLKIVSNASNLQMRPLWGLPKEAAEFLVDAVDVGRLLLIAVIALNESILFDMEYLKLIGYADLMV
ncbi:hypothetical protein C3L33_12681, partial [Rhododendron williamsianum]